MRDATTEIIEALRAVDAQEAGILKRIVIDWDNGPGSMHMEVEYYEPGISLDPTCYPEDSEVTQ